LPALRAGRRHDAAARGGRLHAALHGRGTRGRRVIERWRRLAVEGVERVPARGGALLVANRAGVAPLDAVMIARALPRRARFLAEDWAFALPWVSIAVRQAGGVPALTVNAERLLAEGELVIASVGPPRGD